MLIFPFAGGCRFSPMLLGVVGVVGCDSLSFISLVTQPEKSSNLIWRIWPFKCHSDFRDLGAQALRKNAIWWRPEGVAGARTDIWNADSLPVQGRLFCVFMNVGISWRTDGVRWGHFSSWIFL